MLGNPMNYKEIMLLDWEAYWLRSRSPEPLDTGRSGMHRLSTDAEAVRDCSRLGPLIQCGQQECRFIELLRQTGIQIQET